MCKINSPKIEGPKEQTVGKHSVNTQQNYNTLKTTTRLQWNYADSFICLSICLASCVMLTK